MSSKRGGVHFVKTTVIGGLLFMVPVVVLFLVLSEARGLMLMVAEPMAGWFPVEVVGGVALANIIAAVALVLVCFIADQSTAPGCGSTRWAKSAMISISLRGPGKRRGPPSLNRTKLNIDSCVVGSGSSSRAKTGST